MLQVNAGSPGSGGASPYLPPKSCSCSLLFSWSIFEGGSRKGEHEHDFEAGSPGSSGASSYLKANSRDSPEPGSDAGSVPR